MAQGGTLGKKGPGGGGQGGEKKWNHGGGNQVLNEATQHPKRLRGKMEGNVSGSKTSREN